MIKISDSRKISRVVISTAFGLDGNGIFPHTLRPEYNRLLKTVRETETTVLTKSITRYPRKGNFIPWNSFTWKYIQKMPNGGMLNAYGLTNPGIVKCANKFKNNGKTMVIPSFYPEFSKSGDTAIYETRVAVGLLDEIGVPAIELNFSCPNSEEIIGKNMKGSLACVRELKKYFPWMFIIAKISIVHPYEFAQELELAGVDVIHSINTIPFEMVYPDKISPLVNVGGGGVSGKPIFWLAYDYNKELIKKVKIPIIMGGGVTNSDHAIKYLGIGASAVSICTVILRKPREARKIVELLNI